MPPQIPSQPRACREDVVRGNRLFPSRSDRTWWVLSELRRVFLKVADRCTQRGVKTVIDYGCGNMPYRPLFEQKGIQYKGFDFPPNDKADGWLAPDGRLPVEAACAEALLSSQVLEHVADPNRYLQEARRVLADGGWLILSTHGVWKYHPDPVDLWRWTGDGLRKIVEDQGFSIESLEGLVGPAAMGIQLFQDALGGKVPQRLRKLFFCTCQLAMQFLDRRLPPEVKAKDAGVYVLIAVKHPQAG